MARFRYNGEKKRDKFIKKYGETKQIRIPNSQGSKTEYNALDQMMGFIKGQDMGFEITDSWSLFVLRADTRFEEIK